MVLAGGQAPESDGATPSTTVGGAEAAATQSAAAAAEALATRASAIRPPRMNPLRRGSV